jgi:hypothetical protein
MPSAVVGQSAKIAGNRSDSVFTPTIQTSVRASRVNDGRPPSAQYWTHIIQQHDPARMTGSSNRSECDEDRRVTVPVGSLSTNCQTVKGGPA